MLAVKLNDAPVVVQFYFHLPVLPGATIKHSALAVFALAVYSMKGPYKKGNHPQIEQARREKAMRRCKQMPERRFPPPRSLAVNLLTALGKPCLPQ